MGLSRPCTFVFAKYPEPCVHAKEGVACYVGSKGTYDGWAVLGLCVCAVGRRGGKRCTRTIRQPMRMGENRAPRGKAGWAKRETDIMGMGLQDTASIDMEKHRHRDDLPTAVPNGDGQQQSSVGSVGSVRLPGGTVGRGEVFGSLGADFACQSIINASSDSKRSGVGPDLERVWKEARKRRCVARAVMGKTHENRAGSQIVNVSSEVTMECEILILWRGGGEGADAAGPGQAPPPERGHTHHTTRGHQHQRDTRGCQRLGVEGWFVVGRSMDDPDCHSPGPLLVRTWNAPTRMVEKSNGV